MDLGLPTYRVEIVAPCADKSATPGPIDIAHLRKFTLGNRALELEVLAMFAKQVPTILERLTQAVTEKSWYEAAHTLKGSARAVGAREIASLAERAEHIGVAGQERRAVMTALAVAVRDAADFVDALVATNLAPRSA